MSGENKLKEQNAAFRFLKNTPADQIKGMGLTEDNLSEKIKASERTAA